MPDAATDLDAAFAALADPTRRAILLRLAQGSATVTDLAAPFPISQPAISRHLRVLEEAGLIATAVSGSARPRNLTAAPLHLAFDWLSDFRAHWEGNFARLDAVLDALQSSETDGKGPHDDNPDPDIASPAEN